jgi:hypothetical protein
MNVKLIRMWSGEDVVCDLLETKDNTIVITNPIVAIPSGQGQIAFAPWSPILKGKGVELEIPRAYVVYTSEPQDEIVDQYTEMFSILKTPQKKLIV